MLGFRSTPGCPRGRASGSSCRPRLSTVREITVESQSRPGEWDAHGLSVGVSRSSLHRRTSPAHHPVPQRRLAAAGERGGRGEELSSVAPSVSIPRTSRGHLSARALPALRRVVRRAWRASRTVISRTVLNREGDCAGLSRSVKLPFPSDLPDALIGRFPMTRRSLALLAGIALPLLVGSLCSGQTIPGELPIGPGGSYIPGGESGQTSGSGEQPTRQVTPSTDPRRKKFIEALFRQIGQLKPTDAPRGASTISSSWNRRRKRPDAGRGGLL